MTVACRIFFKIFLVVFFSSYILFQGLTFHGDFLSVVFLKFCQRIFYDGNIVFVRPVYASPVLVAYVCTLPVYGCGVDGIVIFFKYGIKVRNGGVVCDLYGLAESRIKTAYFSVSHRIGFSVGISGFGGYDALYLGIHISL